MLQFIKESRVLIILGISSIIFFSSFYVHYVHEPKKDKIFSIYLNEDLIHINLSKLIVFYESSDKTITFDSEEQLFEWIEDKSAKQNIPSGYADDIQFYIDQGFITCNIHPNINNKGEVISPVGKIDIWYSGPNWTEDSSRDTSYIISTFNSIEDYNVEYDEFLQNTYTMYVGYGRL